MKIIEDIKDFLYNLDAKEFYRYLGLTFAVICLLICFIIYRFYSKIGYYKSQIHTVNVQREEIRELLEKAALTKEQKREVNAMLEADPGFKIGGYFKEVLKQLGITNKNLSSTITRQERGEQEYNERILSAKFTDMNMKELTELLNVLEENKRIYIKELEIQKSRKASRTIEVQLAIATLEPRNETSEYVE